MRSDLLELGRIWKERHEFGPESHFPPAVLWTVYRHVSKHESV